MIAFGGNDGLHGQPLDALGGKLVRMVDRVREYGSVPVRAGMMISPQRHGPGYSDARLGIAFPTACPPQCGSVSKVRPQT